MSTIASVSFYAPVYLPSDYLTLLVRQLKYRTRQNPCSQELALVGETIRRLAQGREDLAEVLQGFAQLV